MSTHYVFTIASLDRCLQMTSNDAWFTSLDVPDIAKWGVAVVRHGQAAYVIRTTDTVDSPRIVLIGDGDTPVSPLPADSLNVVFQRIHRVALGSVSPPVRLPPAWTEFHYENFVAFFAMPRTAAGAPGLRWLAEIHPESSRDVCFWRLTSPEHPVQLEGYKPPYEIYRQVIANWRSAFDQAIRELKEAAPHAETAVLEPTIDLEATGFGPVTQYRTYSSWLEHLSEQQRRFVDWPPEYAVKLRGPAGSGKTLALALKALRELYAARNKGEAIRILFATHSWAVAEQVDSAISRLDESGGTPEIEVFPLLEIARSRVPVERRPGQGVELLGEDSLSGRLLQLRRIDSVLDRLLKSDWLTYRRKVSEQFRSRIEALPETSERRALVWDVMVEFASVFGGERILPGVNGERRYLALQRRPWMMPLEEQADREVVFQLYSEYVAGLAQDRLLTVDQLVTDFLNYLETFSWNILRDSNGYDLVFVDELHLFTEQERLSLHFLTRPASKYPRLFMALDPRQAPSEVYAGVPTALVARGESGKADTDLGNITSVELSRVHRFSPEILTLIQHLHRSYPALDLGPDWEVDLDSVESSAAHGPIPRISVHADQRAEIDAVISRMNELQATMDPSSRLAVIVLDSLQLDAFVDAIREKSRVRIGVIQSRDDVDTVLRYSRRSVIVGAAEYVAGLQFDYVIVAGFLGLGANPKDLAYQRRRTLTLIYLAVSRAARYVELHVNDEGGGVPRVVEEALTSGVVERA